MAWFDESRLDDERALAGIDPVLRGLAESGARVRRAAAEAAEDAAVGRELSRELDRPRTVVLLGAEADLVRAVLEPDGGVPVVAWGREELPGWVGGLDLVVVLAPDGSPDAVAAAQAAAAVRRGCQVVAVCGPGSAVADHAAGRWSAVLTTRSGEPLVAAAVAVAHLTAVRRGPDLDVEPVAAALDEVAVGCSPFIDAATNPAKLAAIGLADTLPLVATMTASPLALLTAERVAAALRRLTGLPVLGGGVATVVPVLEAAAPRSVFEDPYDAPAAQVPPSLLLLADRDAPAGEAVGDLRAVAEARGVRVVDLVVPVSDPLAAHAAVVLRASYAAAYLRLGLVDE